MTALDREIDKLERRVTRFRVKYFIRKDPDCRKHGPNYDRIEAKHIKMTLYLLSLYRQRDGKPAERKKRKKQKSVRKHKGTKLVQRRLL